MSVITIYQTPSEQLVLDMLRSVFTSGQEHGLHFVNDGITQDFILKTEKQDDGVVLLKFRASRQGADTSHSAAPFKPMNLYQDVIAQVNALMAQAQVSKYARFEDNILDGSSASVDGTIRLDAEEAARLKGEVDKGLRSVSLRVSPKGSFVAEELAKAQEREAKSLGGGVAI